MGYYADNVLQNKGALDTIRKAVDRLAGTHYFAAALEKAAEGLSQVSSTGATAECLAVNAGFLSGYKAALDDLLFYGGKIGNQASPEIDESSIPDSGVIDKLVENNTISQEEADELRAK